MNPPASAGESPERPEIAKAPVTAFAIGLAAGAGSALLGIGGGLLMVPAMVFMLRFRQHRAVGTSLAVILPTAVVAAARYHYEAVARSEPGLDFWVVLCLALGGVVGARGGAALANALKGRQLRRAFGVFVILTGLSMLWKSTEGSANPGPAVPIDLTHGLQLLAVGVLVGCVAGLLGVGGGLVMVPALALLLGYGQHRAQGTSLAVIIPVSVSAGLVHVAAGNVSVRVGIPMGLGAIAGAWITAGKVYNIADGDLRLLFAVFLMCVGAAMVVTRRGGPGASTRARRKPRTPPRNGPGPR